MALEDDAPPNIAHSSHAPPNIAHSSHASSEAPVITQSGGAADGLSHAHAYHVPNGGSESVAPPSGALPFPHPQQRSPKVFSHSVTHVAEGDLSHTHHAVRTASDSVPSDMSSKDTVKLEPRSQESVPSPAHSLATSHVESFKASLGVGVPLGDSADGLLPPPVAAAQRVVAQVEGDTAILAPPSDGVLAPLTTAAVGSAMPPPAGVPAPGDTGVGVLYRFKAQEAREREERARRRLAAGLPAEDPATPGHVGGFILSPSASITSGTSPLSSVRSAVAAALSVGLFVGEFQQYAPAPQNVHVARSLQCNSPVLEESTIK